MTTQSEPADDVNNRGANSQGAASSPRVEATPACSKPHPGADANRNAPDQERKHWLEYATGFFALVAALGSMSAVFVGYWQWSAMRENNKISRESFTSVQRAFVTISSFDTPIRLGDVPGQPGKLVKYWWFIPNIRNNGNTPTKDMQYFVGATCPREMTWSMPGRMAIACDFTRQDILDPVDIFQKPAFKDMGSAAILGPQSAIGLGGIGITENSIQAILNGYQMYLFGLVYYHDIFPDTPQHITKFCYQIGANRSDNDEIVSSFGFCTHWNCADDECKDDRKAWETDVAAGKIKKPFEIPAGATPFNIPIPVTPAPNTPTAASPKQQ
jgi:hypothetical protein